MTPRNNPRQLAASAAAEPAPRVSVVVPVYNRAAFLADCLQSVQQQTLTDWECLVIDDGSTDGSVGIAVDFTTRDRRFRLERMPTNRGVSAARNRGIALARGRYVAFLDSDDMFVPDRLAWQVDALEADPQAVLVYGETLQYRGDDPAQGTVYLARLPRKPAGDAFEDLLCCSAIYAPLVRRETLLATGGFDESLAWGEDWDAWLAVARHGRLIHRDVVALHYRLHGDNASERALESYQGAWRVARRHLRHVPWGRRAWMAGRVWRYFSSTAYPARLLREAEHQDRAGNWPAARSAWQATLFLQPTQLRRPRSLALGFWSLLPTRRPPPWRHWCAGQRSTTPNHPERRRGRHGA